ncbi:permease [Sulfurimonas paralvinellae]|uniref:Permease n=1 Tax=Sulfurimonas paralvinellae TaxID=317658 RepID=A0A7M1BAK8_9BACT|nr:permease [Sulfurimonas paralvinellae]QOP45792.1 permease [Sulfurimonas paralvinellae]
MSTQKSPKNKSGIIMLGIVILLYTILYFYHPDKIIASFKASLETLKMIVPILLIVFFLMALLNTFIDEKSIAKHLGEDSGVKGWTITLFGGILSHGPGYIWYPMLEELRKKGALDGLIVAFLYARSIKLPWLPLMISYFGLTFTFVLSFYVILGAFFQGFITNRLSKTIH